MYIIIILLLYVKHKLTCKYCDECFNNQCALNLHTKKHTNKPWKCGLCGKIFKHKKVLALHIMIHEIKRAHKCSECPMLFRKETTLAAHMATHIDARP